MKHRLFFLSFMLGAGTSICPAALLRVPQDYANIQTALDAAKKGDTVQVSPGTYREKLLIARDVILSSENPDAPERTILSGESLDGKKGSGAILSVAPETSFDTKVIGFTFQHGDHGVLTRGRVQVLQNRFIENRDAVSCESGGAIVRGNLFERNRDDGIDMDGASYAVVENNIIRDNRDDGLELRLHNYSGQDTLEITIRGNTFSGNGGDGVQLIDYPGKTRRSVRIERNLFTRNAMAAIGAMADGKTKQNFQGAELLEPVLIVNNTIVDSNYGIIGGENMLVVNNVITRVKNSALRRVAGDSVAGVNLLWANGLDFDECDLDQALTMARDPQLDDAHQPRAGSPCIDAGLATFDANGQHLALPAESFHGKSPDLGFFETQPSAP